MAFCWPGMYLSTPAFAARGGAAPGIAAFADFFRGLPEFFPGIRNSPRGLISPCPSRASRRQCWGSGLAGSGLHDLLQRRDQPPRHALDVKTQGRGRVEARGRQTSKHNGAESRNRRRIHLRSAALAPDHFEVGLCDAVVDAPDKIDVALIVRERAMLERVVAKLMQREAKRLGRIGAQQD